MLYYHMDEKMAEARIDAIIEDVKEYRQAQKVNRERTFRMPNLSQLFASWKSEPEQDTAVVTQPC